MKEIYDCIVIGGGASGMMAATIAGRNGKKVLILEKNEVLGAKLKITGGGRCNILNANPNKKEFIAKYGEDSKFLHSLFASFSIQETIKFFESIGIKIKIENEYRAFPISEKAADVYDALLNELQKYSVKIQTQAEVKEMFFEKNIEGTYKVNHLKLNDDSILSANEYILATGGYSHPETGSTGDGYKFLKKIGINITSPNPDLVPVKIEEKYISKLSGKTINNVKITLLVDGIKKQIIKPTLLKSNKILFTHFGLSGPGIINNSRLINNLLHEGKVNIQFDLFPHLDDSMLNKFILDIFDKNKNKKLKNILEEIYEGNILEVFIKNETSIDTSRAVNDIRIEERKIIVKLLKCINLTILGLMGYEKAIIANGGVSPEDIDFKTMNLNGVSNLKLTGDLIDISRPSGGYSLQLCWSTGFVAGNTLI